MSITNRMESNHTMVTEGRQRIVRVLSTEYVDWLNEIRRLEADNIALKRITNEFGGYKVFELLKVIASDYKNPRTTDIVRGARCTWLMDFADILLKEGKR